ncbi:ribosome-associated translation inhibitor RaiA [Patescibacteria group bacterium]|nr:ribosome-associated translation inhibitor RaiA [Patescibacteria group bacterium]MBU0879818.1 ribosome-associated translation inhibitor RaiA [Patescibacteria group bacterium]MBU0880233.1 ribosome-associated translation inhibitor RaiA [Patescibacteria group bacterium]MBU0898090.1 ribosome-associated translation inhibitor RaiA [Patescibacteria group bacterium]MBU1062554.1 ribosome-associated translation inhibitor RaiA [Patescibacteria group bacterium]
MQLNIKATNIELTSEIKDYVQKKVDMLDKFLGKIQTLNASFEVELITNHHLKGEIYRAEMNLEILGELLRVEKTEKDLFKAIEKVKEHMAEIIKKYKEKKIDGKRMAKLE